MSGGAKATSVTVSGQQLPCEPEEEGEAVTATVERPGSDGVLPGTVVELTSCNGAYGDWSGVFRLGGLSSGGFEVPFVEAPVAFSFTGTSGTQTATATVSGNVPTPAGDFAVTFDLVITVDGSTMSITGTGNIAGTIVALSDTMPGELASIAIVPTDELLTRSGRSRPGFVTCCRACASRRRAARLEVGAETGGWWVLSTSLIVQADERPATRRRDVRVGRR